MITILDENYKIRNVPWTLSVIPRGSMDSNKVCTELLAQITSLNKFGVSADEEFMKYLRCITAMRFTPSLHILLYMLDAVDFQKKKLILSFKTDRLPWLMVVALMKKLVRF